MYLSSSRPIKDMRATKEEKKEEEEEEEVERGGEEKSMVNGISGLQHIHVLTHTYRCTCAHNELRV